MTATATALPDTVRLGFGRLIRSEWIKLRSIRSTWWCYAILVTVTIAMAVVLGAYVVSPDNAPQEVANGSFVSINTTGVSLSALVVAVLGVLIITGEYGTGQVRSTFTADPRRTGVILAKATVLALTTFVVSIASTWIGVVLSALLVAADGTSPHIGDPTVFMPILGSSVYMTLVAMLAYGIGVLVRSSAGGIAVTLGVLLVLPVILSLVAGLLNAEWISEVFKFLPNQAGSQLFAYPYTRADAGPTSGVVLNGWAGFGVLAGEVLVVGMLALTVARRRDI